jgi:hypothetical protein
MGISPFLFCFKERKRFLASLGRKEVFFIFVREMFIRDPAFSTGCQYSTEMSVPEKEKLSVYQKRGLFGHKFEKQNYKLVADRSWQAGKVELIYIDILDCPKTTTGPLVFCHGHWGRHTRMKFYLD